MAGGSGEVWRLRCREECERHGAGGSMAFEFVAFEFVAFEFIALGFAR